MHEAALRPVVAGWKLVIVRCSKGLAFDLEEQLQIGAERQIGGRRELPGRQRRPEVDGTPRSEEHTSELQSLMRISYAVFCLKKKTTQQTHTQYKDAQIRKHQNMKDTA